MKVLLVSDARSIHTKRWAYSLGNAGIDVVVYSINPPEDDFYGKAGLKLHVFDLFRYKEKGGLLSRFSGIASHFRAVRDLKSVLEEENPDILHAHYATSYGLVAALSGFHPFIISVWGSDVYEFPYKSFLNRLTVRYILKKADRVLSTSRVMAAQTARFCRKNIGITPFGVDTGLFDRKAVGRKDNAVVFGTVKTLSHKYGIDILIGAFARLLEIIDEKMPGRLPVRLEIVGRGSDREALEDLASRLKVADKVNFRGYVPNELLPEVYSGFDVAVFLSREESFGVAAVEAMSCRCPVVVSDADGFREVVDNGRTGIVVPRNDVVAAAEAMFRLACNTDERVAFGKEGRRRVQSLYEWDDNVKTVISEYSDILDRR